MSDEVSGGAVLGVGGIITVLVVVIGGGLMYGCPQYSVYTQRTTGEAELARAEFGKRVMVQEAQARLDSSTLYAKAEVERAKGVAEANKIIGDSLKGNTDYLKYLWITDVAGGNGAKPPTVIYVPTEANMPILEAGKAPRP